MGTAAIQALIAGLGGGAESLGSSLEKRDANKAAADLALKKIALNNELAGHGLRIVMGADGTEHVVDMRSGTEKPITAAPDQSTPPAPAPDFSIKAPSLRTGPGPSAAVSSLTGAPQAPTESPPAPMPPTQQPTVLKGVVKPVAQPKLDPNSPEVIKAKLQAKISADSAHVANAPVTRTPKSFTENGQPVQGSVDKTGTYYRADGSKATGKIGVYANPNATAMTRGLGSGGVLGAASGIGSVGEMEAAIPNLEKFENGFDPKNATPSDIKAIDVFRRQLLTDEKSGVFDAAKVAAAAENLVIENPELAIYGRNVAQWIVSDLNLSRNATDKRGALDMGASALALPVSNMAPEQRMRLIQQMQAGRRARLAGLKAGAEATRGMLKKIVQSTGGDTNVFNAPGAKPAAAPAAGKPTNPFADLIPKKPEDNEE